MGMSEWATDEVRRACLKENPDMTFDKDGMPTSFDYGCACYASALKAYKCLMEDGHSGMSFGFTRHILNELMSGKPLTPLTGEDDEWNLIADTAGKWKYQNNRRSSLFKTIHDDGTIEYSDIDMFVCIDINSNNSHYSGFVSQLLKDIFTITFPYIPKDTIKVYTEDFLVDRRNGDFDTYGIFYYMKDGEKVNVNRFFKASDSESGWEEIDMSEYDERKRNKIEVH